MSESLRELAIVEYGASPKEIRVENETPIKIFGTGGLVGYSRIPLFKEPLIVVARKGTLDKPIFSENPCWVIDTAFAVIPKKDVDAKWLYYQLSNYDLKKLNEATGVPSINRDFLYRIKFKKLPLPTQRKIARILSTADAVIEKTQAAIAKYKAIKQGMLIDLFARGIDLSTGKLRPTYEDAPELYKESKLGWIPKEWEVERFKDITTILTCGVASTPKYVTPDAGTPFLSAQNVQSTGIVLDKFSYISNDFYKELTKINKPCFGDILYSRVGAGYGQSAVVEFNWEFSVYVSLTLIRMKKGYNNYFYSHLLNSKPYKEKASINVFQGGGVPNLNVNEVRVFDMICPNKKEQELIADRLNSIDSKLQSEQTYLHKLQQIKAGLMADLLSGKKKATVDGEP